MATLHLLLKVFPLFYGYDNMLFDGQPLDHYDEEELAKILERENREKEELAARLECLEREAKQIHLQNLIRQINEVQFIKNDLQCADAAEQLISNSHKNLPYLTLFFFQSTHFRFSYCHFELGVHQANFTYFIFNIYLQRS